MRGRFAVPVALLATVAVPASAQAGIKHHGHKHSGYYGQNVSINATPNPDVTGTPLTIYGQLRAHDVSDRLVLLWHRVAGQRRFTVIQKTHTDATGFYRFNRADGIVRTNRNWFVRSAGAQSRTVHERVYAEVSPATPLSPALTHRVVRFSGTVTPGGAHRGERVFLQAQDGLNGDKWRNVDSARVLGDGSYTIDHRFRQPGTKTVRVVLPRDRFNLRSASDPVSVDVEQAQRIGFTINASDTSIDAGGSVTVSGALAAPDNANRTLTLYAREQYRGRFHKVGTTATDAGGNYTFGPQSPPRNEIYQVRTGTGRRTSQLFVAVHDVVTVTASATTAHVGDTVAFSGSVLPNKTGHVIYLERKGDDGYFHVVQYGRVQAGSTYSFSHTFATTGPHVFRVLIPGGPVNARGVTDPVTVDVS